MKFTAAPNQYPMKCLGCSYIVPPKFEWQEDQQPEFCPTDGMPMERLACSECNAPLTVIGDGMGTDPWGRPLRGHAADFCGHCGASTAPPKEPQMLMRIKKHAEERKFKAFEGALPDMLAALHKRAAEAFLVRIDKEITRPAEQFKMPTAVTKKDRKRGKKKEKA